MYLIMGSGRTETLEVKLYMPAFISWDGPTSFSVFSITPPPQNTLFFKLFFLNNHEVFRDRDFWQSTAKSRAFT